jgi:hypothetical protein
VVWANFLRLILPSLYALARDLFTRHKGDVEAAKVEIHNIRSRKAEIEADRARIDAEVARLKGGT